jgi:hypothetical protein
VRPDALGLVRAFPFIWLPSSPPAVIGSALFISELPSLSAVTSMPLFCLLFLCGLPALRRRPGIGPLVAALAGTALAYISTLLVATIATRYLSDLLPFLWLAACAGAQALAGSERARSRRMRSVVVCGIGVLTLAGIAINGAVGIVQQRLLAPTTSAAQRASFVQAQEDVDHFLGRRPHGIHVGSAVPTKALGPLGDLFVLGHCAGLYVETFGGSWVPVERTALSGLHDLRIRFPAALPRGPAALFTLGAGPSRVTVVLHSGALSVLVGGRTVATSPPAAVPHATTVPVSASIDPLNGHWYLSVAIGDHGATVLAPVPYRRLARVYLGADPGDPQLQHFPGSVVAVPERAPVCDELVRRARLY